jgi:C-terminal processing protease CtpA/Prc
MTKFPNIKALIVIMSHLSDAQESLSRDSSGASEHINFAKFLLLKYKDTNTIIDADAEWEEYSNRKSKLNENYKRKINEGSDITKAEIKSMIKDMLDADNKNLTKDQEKIVRDLVKEMLVKYHRILWTKSNYFTSAL